MHYFGRSQNHTEKQLNGSLTMFNTQKHWKLRIEIKMTKRFMNKYE